MIPEKVRFTGVTIAARDLLYGYEGRKATLPCPATWTRLEFDIDGFYDNVLGKVDSWICQSINGRWGSYIGHGGHKAVVFFEDDNDAVLFRLMSGETAWKEQEPVSN